MNQLTVDYELLPGVVPSGRLSRVRIVPRAPHARFDDKIHRMTWDQKFTPHPFPPAQFTPDSEISYLVYFLPMQETLLPEALSAYDHARVKPGQDGSLEVEYCFRGEQEYKLIVMDPQDETRQLLRLPIYCLNDDFYGLRAFRGDFHVHSYLSDGREAPEFVAASYRKQGFDFMALTDHHKRFSSQMLIDYYQSLPIDLRLFPGEEVHVPYPSYIHAINFGGDSSVNEWYVDHQEACDAEIQALAKSLTDVPAEAYRLQIAQRIWVARQIQARKGLSILVHPHWMDNAYNMPDSVTNYLFDHGVYDAFELIGGQTVHENNTQVALYTDARARGCQIPVVGASDSHGTVPPVYFTESSTLVLSEGDTLKQLTEAVKSQHSAAVEQPAGESYRVYGPYRMVMYARYLLETYFPRHDELCYEEGRLMMAYVNGDPSAKNMLALLSGRCQSWADQFFGSKADSISS